MTTKHFELTDREKRLLQHGGNDEPPKRKNIIQPKDLGISNRNRFVGIGPERIRSILNRLEDGNLVAFEEWADLASFMIRNDSQVSSVYETRINAVAGKRWLVKPPKGAKDQVAIDAAEFVQNSFRQVPRLRTVFKELLHAEGLGWSGVEHNWFDLDGGWHSFPSKILPRDIAFHDDFRPMVRTFKNGLTPEWIKGANKPDKFIFHIPGGLGETPNNAGHLLAVVWDWLFKRWAVVFEQNGLEVFGNPKLLGKLSDNASEEAVDALFEALKGMTDDQTGIVLGDTDIEIKESTRVAGDSFQQAIKGRDHAITKGILGSTLNVEIGSIGSKAAAESQADTTIMSRIESDAHNLESTIREQWIKPLIHFNFPDGTPIPEFEFVLVEPRKKQVDPRLIEAAIEAQAISVNELREMVGLDPRNEEEDEKPAQIEASERPSIRLDLFKDNGLVCIGDFPSADTAKHRAKEILVSDPELKGARIGADALLSKFDKNMQVSFEEIADVDSLDLSVVKRGNKWCAVSEDGSREFGCFRTKKAANARIGEVDFFKRQDQKKKSVKGPASS